MRRFVILASVMVLAAASANCGSNSEKPVLGPSSLSGSDAVSANWKGGGSQPGGGGTTGGSGSLSLVTPPYIDNNGDGLPNWNDTVTFNVSTTATDTPTVTLTCYQNGVGVYGASGGFYASDPFQPELGTRPAFGGMVGRRGQLHRNADTSGRLACARHTELQRRCVVDRAGLPCLHARPAPLRELMRGPALLRGPASCHPPRPSGAACRTPCPCHHHLSTA